MKLMFLIFAFSTCTSKHVVDSCIKCDIEIISKVLNDKSAIAVNDFICTTDSSCVNNVEFLEYYNESLFILLKESPQLLIEVLSSYNHFKIMEVMNILEAPINDNIDILELINLTKNQTFDNQEQEKTKQMILKSLKIARDKS